MATTPIRDRFRAAFDVFRQKRDIVDNRGSPWSLDNWDYREYGTGSMYRPDRSRQFFSGKENIIDSIINRIAMDVAAINIRHIKQDEEYRFKEMIKSGLYECLEFDANVDQSGRAFRQDLTQTILEEGVAAVVAVDTTVPVNDVTMKDIRSIRVGRIQEWFPRHVMVNVYDDRDGERKDIILPKADVAIIENPLYTIMNRPNSTLRRLTRKLHLLDAIDEQSGSGRLDIIVQLPYVVKSEARREQASKRLQMIEEQLQDSKHGIAYTDGTEKVIQLNRPVENNLFKQVEYLQGMLYSELGITEEIMNGTADEKSMLNYYNRVVEPILSAIIDNLNRVFLTKTARTQGQILRSFNNPFRFVTMSELSEIADRFTRNEILSSNEVRGIMGLEPSDDPRADMLVNKNMPMPGDGDNTSTEVIDVEHDLIEEEKEG